MTTRLGNLAISADEIVCLACGFTSDNTDEAHSHLRDHEQPRTVVDGWVMSFDTADAVRLVGMPDDELAAYETWLEGAA